MMNLFWILARIFVGAFFAYAGLSKLLEPVENFQAILSNYEVIPDFAAAPVALVLPWLEWIFGSLLILGYAPRVTALMLFALSLAFSIVLATSFLTGAGPGKDCGCFGERGIHFSSLEIFALDIVNLLILIRLFFLKNLSWSLDALLRRSPPETHA